MSEEVLRLLAQADSQPVETDAPEEIAIPYDVGLQADLEEFGPEALKEWGRVVVRDVQREDRHNSAVWWAMKWDLVFDRVGDDLVITDPMGAA